MATKTLMAFLAARPNPDRCDCGAEIPLQVLVTCAYYVGRFCPNCGPFSRESGYYRTRAEAEKALATGMFSR